MRRGTLIAVCLAALLAGSIGALTATASTAHRGATDYRRDTECGVVDRDFSVHVVKGAVPCPKALGIAKKYLGERHCGSGNEPACVADGFHCQLASFDLQRNTEIGAYCYVLKHPRPPAKDQSPFRLGSFRSAITIYLQE